MFPKMAKAVLEDAVVDIKDSLSVELTFVKGYAQRSAPGQPPKGGPDKWFLRNSIGYAITDEGGEVFASAAHALGLEQGKRTSATLFIKHARPFMSPAAKRITAKAAELAAQATHK